MGGVIFWYGCNFIIVVLGIGNFFFYFVVYIFMKRFFVVNIWVGVIVGVIIFFMGWIVIGVFFWLMFD